MTAKDFRVIASVISRLDVGKRTKTKVAKAFVEECKRQNSKFKSHLFYKACGLKGTS